ncbi:hypothetical protein BpHYR1_006909 [Brachionus plicatilis]|uniref:Uncharacterized protein n=1 Tax=Brachionus plicatilis TaxID=10195 RepID=A0A3M7QRH6_BRAPC|nr:hypothetical protein BpHYR1_006909 [Brachionus plicatilis]
MNKNLQKDHVGLLNQEAKFNSLFHALFKIILKFDRLTVPTKKIQKNLLLRYSKINSFNNKLLLNSDIKVTKTSFFSLCVTQGRNFNQRI